MSLYLFTRCEPNTAEDAINKVLECYPHGESGYRISPDSVVFYEDKLMVTHLIFEKIFGESVDFSQYGTCMLVKFSGFYGYHDDALWEWMRNNKGVDQL